jgi:hypothetical protein
MSRFADAAFSWLQEHALERKVTTRELWDGLCLADPELTAASEKRKTPYSTFLRDIRLDSKHRFIVGGGFVELSRAKWSLKTRT